MVRLNLIFGSNDEFEKAVDHFENVSDFYPDEKNYRYRQLSFDCNNQEDADMNERAIDEEIMNSFEKYHFEIEDINESKKAKMKTLIERIVERVIVKKLNETRKSKRRLKESTDNDKYADYLQRLNKALNAKPYDPDAVEVLRQRVKLHGNKLGMNNSEIDKAISDKRRLKESVELEDDLGNLDQYIIMNFDEIQKTMEVYGWEPEDIKDMTNYYDVAHLLGVDTRLIKDADLDYITKMAHGIIADINDEERY